MNFYTLAAREEKELKSLCKLYKDCDIDDDTAKRTAEDMLDGKFERTYRRAVKRMLLARQINEELGLTKPMSPRMFFITIRPKCNSITFDDFFILIQKLMARSCFSNYYITFEQKGIEDCDLGHGFHTHIMTTATQKGKAEVIRDVYSSVKHCTEKNCIQVDITYDGPNTFKKYCIDYESKDGHKNLTKISDAKWREKISIADYYENELPNRVPAIKSVAGTYIIEME